MGTSIFLAKLIGPVCLVIGIALLINRAAFRTLAGEFLNNPPLMFLSGILPNRFDWKLGAATGGLGVAQLVSIFFTRPMADLYQNLSNLAGFKMVLESHALKTAIMRFHLTTARTLQPIETDELKDAALRQIAVLNHQLTVIGKADEADFAHLRALGFHEVKDIAASDSRKNGGRVDGARKAPAGPDVSGGASPAKAD